MTLELSGRRLIARRDAELIDQFFYAGNDTFVADDLPNELVVERGENGVITAFSEIELGPSGPILSSSTRFSKIGPLARLMTHKLEASPLGNRIDSVIASLKAGRSAIQSEQAMTTELRRDLGGGPVPEVAGLKSISFLGTEHVEGRKIRRHGNTVGTVLYYRLSSDGSTSYLLIYLTATGLIPDFDRVPE